MARQPAEQVTEQPTNQPTIGLALGGGAARGWAHIGVIRALQEAGIRPSYVAGCSMGSLVGAAYACGALDELEAKARALTPRTVLAYLDPVVPVRGLLGGEGINKLFSELLGERETGTLPLPFCAVATDLATGKAEILSGGKLADAVRASCAVPGIFTPCERDGRFLVDGGLVNPVPVDVVRNMGADYVIAVDLNHDIVDCPWCASPPDGPSSGPENGAGNGPSPRSDQDEKGEKPSLASLGETLGETLGDAIDSALDRGAELKDRAMRWVVKSARPNVFDVIGSTVNIVEAELTRVNLQRHPADLLIQPPLGHMALWGFADAAYAIDIGRKAAERALDALPRPPAP